MWMVMTLAFASWVISSPIQAQELRLEVHAGQVTDERGEPQVAATVTPSFARIGESAAVALGGETIFPVTGGMIGTAGLRFRAWSADQGAGVALSLEAAGSGSMAGFRSFGASLSPRGA